ncbi:MAG TPA: alkaline phosphatase family protein [Actinomycetota bacterium]
MAAPASIARRRSLMFTVVGLVAIVAGALAWPTARGSDPPRSSATSDVPSPEPPASESPRPGRQARSVCQAVPRDVLVRTFNGTHPVRSGDLQMITPFPDYVAGGLTHAPPFDHTQEVPLLLYAPGVVRSGLYDEPATLSDLSATTASMLEFDGFTAPDGRSLDEALLPPDERRPPKLIVTMIWDSAGRDLLERWNGSWPFLRELSREGAWFTDVELNAAPANTPPSHATIGTGAYPRRHGLVDEYIWIDGALQKPNAEGPTFLKLPTLADAYDLAMDNEPIVAGAASLSAHLMMMSHGLGWTGGDDDIAIAREVENAVTGGDDTAEEWGLTNGMRPYYRVPDYANDPSIDASLEAAKAALDRRDGSADGLWQGYSIEQMAGGFNTPARSAYQTTLFEEIVRREGMGEDDVPDLLYVNYKIIDTLGHQFSSGGAPMADALEIQDDELRRFVRFLDDEVGRGKWGLILTADHGMQRDPDATGAFLIDIERLSAAVEGAFGGTEARPVIRKARPTQMWLDEGLLERNGYTVAQVAGFIGGLTQADVAGVTGAQPGEESDPAFQAVFPTSLFETLPCLADVRDSD